MTDIAKIDEKQAVMEAFSPLCEFLPEFVRDCTANIKKDLASYKRLSDRQKSRIAAYLINMPLIPSHVVCRVPVIRWRAGRDTARMVRRVWASLWSTSLVNPI